MSDPHDVLRSSFVRFKLPGEIPEVRFQKRETALLVIDMQRMNAHRDGKYGIWAKSQGIGSQLEYYFDRLERVTVPRISELIEACRRAGIEVIYSRVAALTHDGREMGWRYKAWNITDHVDSPVAK
jgi:ureidoacrylate peracid hydrolase